MTDPDAPAVLTPNSLEEWPAHVKRFLYVKAYRKLLELHGDPYRVVEYLYRGSILPDGKSLPWSAPVRDCWPRLKAEADEYMRQKSAGGDARAVAGRGEQ